MPITNFITLTDWRVYDPNNSIAENNKLNTAEGDKYLSVGDYKILELTFDSDIDLHASTDTTVVFNPSLWCDVDQFGQWEFDPAGVKLQPCSAPATSAYSITFGPAEVASLIATPANMVQTDINISEKHFPFQNVTFELDANPNIFRISYPFFVTMDTHNKYLFNEEYNNRRRLQYPLDSVSATTTPFSNPLGKGYMYTSGSFFGIYLNVQVNGPVKTGLKLTNTTTVTTDDTLLIESVDGSDLLAQGWNTIGAGSKVFVEFYPYTDELSGSNFNNQKEIQKIVLQLDLDTGSVVAGSMSGLYDTAAGSLNILDAEFDGKEFYGRIYTNDPTGLDFNYGEAADIEDCQYEYIPARGYWWNEGITIDPQLTIVDSGGVTVGQIPTNAPFTFKFKVVAGIQPTKCKFWVMRQDVADGTPLEFWKEVYTNEPLNWLYGTVPTLVGFSEWESELVVDPALYSFDTGGIYAVGVVWYFENDDDTSPNVVANLTVDDTPLGTGPCTPPITGTLSTYVENYDNYIQASPLQRIISRVTFHKDVYEVCAGPFLDTAALSAICRISEFGSGVVEATYNADRVTLNSYTTSGPELVVFEDGNTVTFELTFRLLEPWATKEMELEWEFGLDIEPVQTFFYQRIVVDDFQENLVTPDLIATNLYDATTGLPIADDAIICPDDASWTGMIVETEKLPTVDYKQVAMWLDAGGIHHEHDPFISPISTPQITDAALYNVDTNFGDTGGADDVQYYADTTVTNGKVGMIGFPEPIAGTSTARVLVHIKRLAERAVVFQSPYNGVVGTVAMLTDSLTADTDYQFKINSNPAGGDIHDPSWTPLTSYDITTIQTQTINAGDYVQIKLDIIPGTFPDVVAVFEYGIDTIPASSPVITITQDNNSTNWDMLLKPFDDVTYTLYPNTGLVNPFIDTRTDAEIVAGDNLTTFSSNTLAITNFAGNGNNGAHIVSANQPYPVSYDIKVDTAIPNTFYVDIAATVRNKYSPNAGNPSAFDYNTLGDYTKIDGTINTAATFDLFGMPNGGILGFAGTFRFNKDLSQDQIFFSHSGDNSNMFTAMGFRNNEFFIEGYNNYLTFTDRGGVKFDASGLNINPLQTYNVVMYLEKVSTGKGFDFAGECWVNGVEIPFIPSGLSSSTLVGPTATFTGASTELALGNYNQTALPHQPTNTQLYSVKDMCILAAKPTTADVRKFYNGNRGIYTVGAEYAWEFDTLLNVNQIPATATAHLADTCYILNNTLPALTTFYI